MSGQIARNARAWQRMLSGRRLDLLDPSPLDVEIDDIAHGLARVARWNGQTKGDYAFSVAQHSLLVTEILPQIMEKADTADILYALLHDAPEYVIGDMISPFKAVMGGEYKQVEMRLEAAINRAAGLAAHPSAKLKKTIKQADRIAAYLEATQLAGFVEKEAKTFFEMPPAELKLAALEPMPASQAQARFRERYGALHAVL